MTNPEAPEPRPFPPIVYNLVTLSGVALGGVSLSLIIFLLLLEVFSGEAHPYMGIIAFVILPVFLLLGVLLIVGGLLREVRLRHRGMASRSFPRIDLNEPSHRRLLLVFGVGAILLVAFSAFGSFQAYEYTDSDAFCGTVCHTVMHPEYTAYHDSPHARVQCVDCHIGPGAEWFVRSKLSGAYQLYAVTFDTYPRPIPTPIEHLRPAKDTCEQCHWPEAFYSDKLSIRHYYLSDEANTPVQIDMLVKIGGGRPGSGHASGIHWHMDLQNEVHYFSADETRQEIPWVRTVGPDGKEKVYRNTESGFSDDQIDPAKIRLMDCLDCHNRPTHNFHPAPERVNFLLSIGHIDPTLPWAKATAVEVLDAGYDSEEEAMHRIDADIQKTYETKHPEVAKSRSTDIEQMIRAVQRTYRQNYFPSMKVSWRAYPDNIGHLYSPGCFRCHDGKHVADDGSVISHDCQSCHALMGERKNAQPATISISGHPFQHPVDIGEAWKEMSCHECHGG